jgi:hypothetical protein
VYGNEVLRKILGPKRKKQKISKNGIIRNFMTSTVCHIIFK